MSHNNSNQRESSLGQLLFERRVSFIKTSVAASLGILFTVLIGIVGAASFYKAGANGELAALRFLTPTNELSNLSIAILCVTGFILCLFAVVVILRSHSGVLQVYEDGLVQQVWNTTNTLRYEEIDRFYFDGIYGVNYAGVDYRMDFIPSKDSGQSPIRFRKSYLKWTIEPGWRDEQLENLRDKVFGIIVAKRIQELQSGQPIDCTNKLRLLPQGLEYHPSRNAKPQVFPYHSISHVEIKRNRTSGRDNFSIYFHDNPKPRISGTTWRQTDLATGLLVLDRQFKIPTHWINPFQQRK